MRTIIKRGTEYEIPENRYTDEELLDIYTKAWKNMIENEKIWCHSGLCFYLRKAQYEYIDKYIDPYSRSLLFNRDTNVWGLPAFEEIFKQVDKSIYEDVYWFSTDKKGTAKRKRILRNAIKEVKERIKNEKNNNTTNISS